MNEINMRRPGGRDRRRGRRASGSPAKTGPTRKIDSEGDLYRKLGVSVSEELLDRIRVAAALEKVSIREFVLRLVIPEVDRVHRENGLS